METQFIPNQYGKKGNLKISLALIITILASILSSIDTKAYVGTVFSIVTGTYVKQSPDISYNPYNGKTLVVWREIKSGDGDIYAVIIDSNGTVGTPFYIENLDGSDSHPPKVTAAANGSYWMVTYTTVDDFGFDYLKLCKISSTGSKTYYDVSSGVKRDNPDIGVDNSTGNVLVVWQQTSTVGGDEIKGRVFNPNTGYFLAGDFTIFSPPIIGTGTQENPSVNPSGNGFIVVEERYYGDTDIQLRARYVTSTGSIPSNDFAITSSGINQAPDVAAQESSGADYFIVWHKQSTSSNWNIYYSFCSASTRICDSPGVVDGSANLEYNPTAIYSGIGGRYIAAYAKVGAGQWSGNWDIYSTGVRIDGQIDPPVALLADSGTSAYGSPAGTMVGGPFGKALIAFDTGNGVGTTIKAGEYSIYSTAARGAFSKNSPADNTTISSQTSVTLSWGSSSGDGWYEYCIDTIINDYCNATWNSTSNNTSIPLSNLTPNTQYEWHVRAKNAGDVSTYSNGSSTAFWTFKTAQPPDITKPSVTLYKPNGGEIWQVGTPQNITWYAWDAVGVTYIELYYSTGSGWIPIATNEPNDGSYPWTVPNSPSSTVKVAIAAFDAADNAGQDDSNANFTIIPSPPAAFGKSSPSDIAINQPTNPTLTWTSSSGATSYQYCLDTSINDTCNSTWIDIGNVTSKALSGLTPNTAYEWHVKATNANPSPTYSNNSSTTFWTFTTAASVPNPPGAFNKSSPSDIAINQPTNPTLTWTSSSGATSYQYCLDTSINDTCNSTWIDIGNVTSKALSGLTPNTAYEWHVKATNANPSPTYSNNSSTTFWTFTTAASVPNPPGAFNKSSPSDIAINQPTNPTLTWTSSSGATSYQYCLDTSINDTCNSTWIDIGNVTSKALSGLTPNTAYEWHVKATNANPSPTYSNNSSTTFWTFTTAASVPNPPGAFNKSSPSDIAINQPTNPTLTWTSSSGATSYQYCLDTSINDTCNSTWIDIGNVTSKALSGLTPNTAYEWHVKATNANPSPTYSNNSSTIFWTFTTQDPQQTPVNDNFDDATVISILPYTVTLDVSKATKASDDPSSCPNQKPQSVWFTYIPTTSGTITIDTTGSNYETNIALWTGTRGNLSKVACDWADPINVNVVGGTTYYLEITNWDAPAPGSTQILYLSITATTPPVQTFITFFRSVGAYDGHILESGENTNVGGIINKTGVTFNLGDNAQDKQYRSILSFNTAALPDNAVITKVTLKIRKQVVVGTNPFTILGRLKADIRKPYFGAFPGLQVTDFQAAANKVLVGTFTNKPVSNWYTAVIGSIGYPYINKTGTTQFRLRFYKDDNDDMGADYMKFFSGNYIYPASRPTLVIEYYVP